MTKKIFSMFVLATFFIAAFVLNASAQSKKSDICHKAGDTYNLLNINNNAIAAHTAHGDGLPGMPVPNMSGYEFSETCEAVAIPLPDFFPFFIRNSNETPNRIAPPWDSDLLVSEIASGNGFSAATPRGGQKVGYGTSFFDDRVLKTLVTVSWQRTSGAENLVAYLNIWVTDGTRYAIISSENNYVNQDFATRAEWKVFEYDTTGGDADALDWLCASGNGGRVNQYLQCDGVNATFNSLSNVTIKSPSAPYPAYVGTGAPRGGYGFNLIWGDTSTNFLGAYSIDSLAITFDDAVFVPTSQDGPTN